VELADKVVIVTGGSSGIGAATARRAAEEGAKVVLAARRTDRIEALAAELPGALAVTTDIRDPEQVRALVQVTLDRHGRVDVLVNNAGRGLHVPLEEVRLQDLQAIIELNGPRRWPACQRRGEGREGVGRPRRQHGWPGSTPAG
jgi:NADP-dependent 3-hydroxy acid dehydrogenase YdfG